jgi:nitrous oxide reductase accessory protein NosL
MDDKRWIDSLDDVGAQAALEALNQHFRGGMTAREAVEFRKLKKALQARANPED